MRILGNAAKSAHDERLAAQVQQRAFCCGDEIVCLAISLGVIEIPKVGGLHHLYKRKAA